MRDRNAYIRKWRQGQKSKDYQKKYRSEHKKEKEPREIIGIDGEGMTVEGYRPDDDFEGPMPGEHRYLYMAAWGSVRKVGDLDLAPYFDMRPSMLALNNPPGRTKACLDFLLSLPTDALIFGFSLGYDYTKILEGLPDKILFELARPELRQGEHGPHARRWGEWSDDDGRGWYKLNYVKGRFSCSKILDGVHKPKCGKPGVCKGCKSIRKVTVWDIFAFFQGAFIKACKEWGVVTAKEYEEIKAMKDRRNSFTEDDWPKVIDYCGQECRKMAQLGERLLEAHEEAGLKLTSYYGAGSTASRMLKVKFDAKAFIADPLPEMAIALACGFFGGRFEVSRVGPIKKPVYSYDIASAYPYQFTFLPCLKCGRWELVQGRELLGRIRSADIALVHYRLPICAAIEYDKKTDSSRLPWGPFPMRAWGLNDKLGGDFVIASLSELPNNGSILYPASSGGGWVYRDEFLVAQEHFPNVEAVEAWIYNTSCSHSPFNDTGGERSTMPEEYKRRLEWGKEGKGIVVKLGTNSCYGKTAQNVGNSPPFQCFVWAGIVTSGCRAQLLDAMSRAKSLESILMTATDGILSLEKLNLPEPRETGTREAALKVGKLPLGAWESKDLPDGAMIIRPGIGFPLNSAVEMEIKARGIGKAVLSKYREDVLAQWERAKGSPFEVHRDLFFGMKSATDGPSNERPYHSRRANYGRWERKKQVVRYDAFPKRPRQNFKSSLRTWAFGPEVESAPYERLLPKDVKEKLKLHRRPIAGVSHEGENEKQLETLMNEQPDREDESDDFGND